jgi:CubicO group peptidase (beta-lactamase class C family)
MIKSSITIFITALFCISLSINKNNISDIQKTETQLDVDPGIISYTEKRIEKVMRKHHIPAFAITIVDDQGIRYQKTFGLADMENNIPAATNTVFKIYSVAKLFTALEIFREVEEELIDLNRPLSEYLPEFTIQSRYNDSKIITVKNILAHRSGLPRNGCILIPDTERDKNKLLRFERSTSDCFMAFPVESRYHYSNLGYNLLGRVIEQNRNEGYASYMRKSLLSDLKMHSSTFNSADIKSPSLVAKGYEYYKGKYYPMSQSDINNVPSGNLYSTIVDISHFLQTVIRNEVFTNKNTMSQMFIDHFSERDDPERMGLGWKTTKIDGTELMVWHDGGPVEGIGALVAYLPERKLGISLIGNSTSFGGNMAAPLAMEIFKKMLEKEDNYTQSDKSDRNKTQQWNLEQYAGKYIAFGRIMDVKVKGRKLKGRIEGIGLDMIPVSETEFRLSHWMDRIGLTKIIKPPIDFNKIKVEFQQGDPENPYNMIINMDNISFEICPKYPAFSSTPAFMNDLAGTYQFTERLPDNKPGKLINRYLSFYIEDNVLVMPDPFGPILPDNDNYFKIAGGPFAGETIEYCPESGNIIHQNSVFVPVKTDDK